VSRHGRRARCMPRRNCHPFSVRRGAGAILRFPFPFSPLRRQVEFILMGGTFMSLDRTYREGFIRSMHDALTGHISASVAEATRSVRPPAG